MIASPSPDQTTYLLGWVLALATALASVILTSTALDTLGLLTAMGISYTAWGLVGLIVAFLLLDDMALPVIPLWIYLSESVHLPETMTTELWIALGLLLIASVLASFTESWIKGVLREHRSRRSQVTGLR